MSRNVEIVDLLLQNIESTEYVNPVNNFGLTHMHIACTRDKPDIVEKFLKSGVGKDISTNLDSPFWPGYTPLHFAVEFSCLDVVQLLIKHKADGKRKDAEGRDPCYLSLYKYQYASMINYFMRLNYTGSYDLINFYVACLEGDERIVEKYLEHGADSCLNYLYIYISLDNTPLHCAARSGSSETVQLLLRQYKVNIYSVNEYGMTPLHAAFYQEARNTLTHENDKRVVEVLYLAYNFKDIENITDENGLSFFHIICSQGDNELIKYFLEKGVDINSQVKECDNLCIQDFSGCTPLYFAVYYRRPSAVKLLLQCGADITISRIDHDNNTPFDHAIEFHYEDVIEAILQSGLDLSTLRTKTGQTLFHHILHDNYNDNRDIIKMFYEKGCNVNIQSSHGNTPLHEANDINAVNIQAVLDLGADINIENINGETPLTSLRNYDLSLIGYEFVELFESYIVYLSHVEKLRAIGAHVSEKNRLLIQQLFEERAEIDPDAKYLDPEYYAVLQHQYKNEIEKMKQMKVSHYSSLYDILFADANRMAFHCNNQAFLNIMKMNDFDNQFPSYGYLLKLQLKKGNERRALLRPAKKALKFILRGELPDFCSENVFSYLSDDDLKTVIKITSNNDTQQIAKNLSSTESITNLETETI